MYRVIELQTDVDGNTSKIVTMHEKKNEAESKFHSVLSFAAESEVPIHACAILNELGENERNEFYKHKPVIPPNEEAAEEEIPVEEAMTEDITV